MVTSYFSFTYGYVEVVARIPGGAGTWPALWLLPADGTNPPEIDMMENWGAPRQILCTVHWGTPGNDRQAYEVVNSASDLTRGWHSYGLLWQPGSLRWYLDGKAVFAFTGRQVPSQPMYFLANLAIDGPAKSGTSYEIRSVKIYE